MANIAMRRFGAAFFLLTKAPAGSAASSGTSRSNWARVYSTSLGVRGGASTEDVEAPSATATSTDPFAHLPKIEVCHVSGMFVLENFIPVVALIQLEQIGLV